MEKPLFRRVLGEDWASLPTPVATIHDIGGGTTWHGRATVEAGTSPLARLIGAIAGFPPTAASVSLSVEMTPDGDAEIWLRNYGDSPLSRLEPGALPGTIEETMSGVSVCLRLEPDKGSLRHVPIGVCVLGFPLPRLFWPTLDVREGADGARYWFSVAMSFWGMLLIRYAGHLETRSDHDA